MKKYLKKIKKLKLKWSKHPVKVGLIVLIILFSLQNLVLAINSLQNKTPIMGLKVNGQPVAFLNRVQIGQLITNQIGQNSRVLKLKYKDLVWQIKPVDLGIKSSVELTNEALEQGRVGNLIDKIAAQDKAFFGWENLQLSGLISQADLTLKILEIKELIDQDSQPIRPDFTLSEASGQAQLTPNLNQTLPAQDGVKVQTDKLTLLITKYIFNPPANPLEIPTYTQFANHHEEAELSSIRLQAQKLTKQPISLRSGGLTFILSRHDLLSMLVVSERPDPQDPKKTRLQLRLDEKKLSQKLGDFAQNVEDISQAEFNAHDSMALIYAQFYSGRRDLVDVPSGQRMQKVLGVEHSPKIAYLTFDDGPNSIYQPLILDILKEKGVKATFFLVGNNTKRDLSVALRTVAEGHVIGNHSLTHPFLPNYSAAYINQEISQTNQILVLVNHNQALTLFRPPYGGVNSAVVKTAQDLNLKLILWDVDPRDWSEPPVDELVKRVVSHTHPGSNILLHSNHLVTVRALPKIIDQLRNQGYSFATLN